MIVILLGTSQKWNLTVFVFCDWFISLSIMSDPIVSQFILGMDRWHQTHSSPRIPNVSPTKNSPSFFLPEFVVNHRPGREGILEADRR